MKLSHLRENLKIQEKLKLPVTPPAFINKFLYARYQKNAENKCCIKNLFLHDVLKIPKKQRKIYLIYLSKKE